MRFQTVFANEALTAAPTGGQVRTDGAAAVVVQNISQWILDVTDESGALIGTVPAWRKGTIPLHDPSRYVTLADSGLGKITDANVTIQRVTAAPWDGKGLDFTIDQPGGGM